MNIVTKKQSVMEGTVLVKELYYLTISNSKGQEITINVGGKTHNAIKTLIEEETSKIKPDAKKS